MSEETHGELSQEEYVQHLLNRITELEALIPKDGYYTHQHEVNKELKRKISQLESQLKEKEQQSTRIQELEKALLTIDYKIHSCTFFTDKDIQDIIHSVLYERLTLPPCTKNLK
jgi:uncharacterized membrane-anchored protein YjiN (DUF445 family)